MWVWYLLLQKNIYTQELAILGFVLVGLVSLLLQKNIYTQELEITRIERRVLFLELDFLFQGVTKPTRTKPRIAIKEHSPFVFSLKFSFQIKSLNTNFLFLFSENF